MKSFRITLQPLVEDRKGLFTLPSFNDRDWFDDEPDLSTEPMPTIEVVVPPRPWYEDYFVTDPETGWTFIRNW